jgi:hypothetical protein
MTTAVEFEQLSDQYHSIDVALLERFYYVIAQFLGGSGFITDLLIWLPRISLRPNSSSQRTPDDAFDGATSSSLSR